MKHEDVAYHETYASRTNESDDTSNICLYPVIHDENSYPERSESDKGLKAVHPKRGDLAGEFCEDGTGVRETKSGT